MQGEFITCIVIDVFYDKTVDIINNVFKTLKTVSVGASLSNVHYFKRCPKNSAIVFIPNLNIYSIVYPMFSSHLSLPLKAGEHVWCIFPGGLDKTDLGYWMTRKSTDEMIDDINVTHSSRAAYSQYTNLERAKSGEDTLENLYNDKSRGFTGYKKLLSESAASGETVYEAVPRRKKRPADLLVQGSNNASMLMTSGDDKETGTTVFSNGIGKTDSTSCDKIENVIGAEENNKASALSGVGKFNRNEGLIDIENDRVTLILSENPSFLNTPDLDYEFNDSSHAFIRADRIRLEGREKISSKTYLYTIESTDVVVSADSVKICDASQPYVRFDELKEVIKSLQSQISYLSSFISTVAPNMAAAKALESGVLSSGGDAVGAATAANDAENIKAMKDKIDVDILGLQPAKILGEFDKVKSSKIFGE